MGELRTETVQAEARTRPKLVRFVRQPLYANAFFLWATAGASAIGGFAFWALVTRLYSTEEVGIGSAALSAITLISTVSHLGLGMGLIRHLPEETDPARRTHLINFALTVGGAVGIVASGIFLAGLSLWSPGLSYLRQEPLYLLAFILFSAASTGASILTMTFVGLRSANLVLLTAVLMQALRLALPVALMRWGAFGIVASGGLAAVLGLLAALFLLRLVQRTYRPQPAFSRSSASLLVPFGLGNQAADLALAAPGLVLPLMVVNALGPESAAHFYIGFFLGAVVLTGVQGLATSLFTEGSYDEGGLSRNAAHALMGSLLISGLGIALVLAAGDKLLLAFGRTYADEATGLLRLVALTALPASVTYTSLTVLRVRRQIKPLLAIALAVCLLSLSLSYLLLPHMGIMGAGVGVLVGQTLGGILGLAVLAKQWTESAHKTLEDWGVQAKAQADEIP